MANRLRGRYGYPADEPFLVTFHPDRLEEPLHWKKPSMVFTCSMGDVFHTGVQANWRDEIFRVMRVCPEHTFMLLTKRPRVALEYLSKRNWISGYWAKAEHTPGASKPLQNVWLGVTAENQQAADERIPLLLQCPAAVRFVSCEPLLGPIEFPLGDETEEMERSEIGLRGCGMGINGESINWVIVGGETGPGARPMNPDWVRSIHDQCQAAGVPFFMKQMSKKTPIPSDLLIRELPEMRP